MKYLCLLALCLPMAGSLNVFAQEVDWGVAPSPAAEAAPPPVDLALPSGIDYPALQTLGGGSTLFVDFTNERSDDLSTFFWVKGRAVGYRAAVGGSLRLGGLLLNIELPVQLTRLYIDSLGDSPPIASDRQKSSFSLGDVVGGGNYAWRLPFDALTALVGVGMRMRLPTHTMQYSFSLANQPKPYSFGFPYYFHLAPAALLFVSYGPLSLTVNQGLLAMLAKNTTLLNMPLNIPNVYFWESHYAAGLRPVHWLTLSLELISCVQLSHIDDDNFKTLNHLKAFYLDPGVAFDIGAYRISLAGRFGLGGDTERFGVITFSGSQAFLARLSYLF